jgi:outer membrane protein
MNGCGDGFMTSKVGIFAFALVVSASAALADEPPQEKKAWQIALGAGAVSMPEYPGSRGSEIRALPLVSVRYKRFFLGGVPGSGSPGGLGAYLHDSETWSLGAVVAPDVMKPREESDDARLRGLGDIDSTIRAGLFASYHIGWLTLRASAMSDIADNQQGTLATIDAEATYRPSPRLSLTAGPGLTWANQESMQTFFGINAQQAARSAFAPYTPESGVNSVRVSFGARYLLTPHWSLGARVTAARLQGDAADSPIVEDENQNSYALFFSYRF